jgi:signal transduction histidine kinase
MNESSITIVTTALLAPLMLHFAARFPQPSGVWRSSLIAYDALIVGLVAALVALPAFIQQWGSAVLALAASVGFVLAGCLFVRTIQVAQNTSPRAAQQARLLLLSLIGAETPFVLHPITNLIAVPIPIQFVLVAQILLPIGLVYTVTRRDLFGIDAALRRALEYTAVSLGLLALYVGINGLLTLLGHNLGTTWGFVATILSVIPVAASFPPLHRGIQRLTDRLFYPERLAFGQAISAARTTLGLVVRREAVVALLEHEFPQHLGATWASLVLRPSFDQPAAAGQPGVWNTLLMVGGEPLGGYWLGPRRSGLRYASDEQEQLQGLIQQAALALAYADTVDSLVQLNQELEERVATRTEHVLAQQRELVTFEERQRLARDLHDSVKQTLFSLGLGLRSARSRVRSDPESAIVLLQQQEQAAIQAQAEMGDLLAQLRTAETDSADLVAILAQHCAQLAEQHGFVVAQDLPPALVVPEPLPRELAQVVREALHNVLRHSGAASAQLTLTLDQALLTVIVADTGCGFDPANQPQGYGLRGIRERVAALGGKLAIQSIPNQGTTLWLQINLRERAPRLLGS